MTSKCWIVTKRVIKDISTSAGGDFDPARVIGYGVVFLGSIEFLVLTAYTTFKSGVFDGTQYAIGLTGISGALAAAAAGVWLKKTTEITPKEKALITEPEEVPKDLK